MKKFFAIIAILSVMMLPCASMAMDQTSDADLAAITGQSGVTIDVSDLNVALLINTITWGDYDGDQDYSTGYANAGYVNISLYPAPMHIGIGNVNLTIDVGSKAVGTAGATNTAVILGVSTSSAITIDAIVADVILDVQNGVLADYTGNAGTPYAHVDSAYAALSSVGLPASAHDRGILGLISEGAVSRLMTKELGVFGISGISVEVPNLVVVISAH